MFKYGLKYTISQVIIGKHLLLCLFVSNHHLSQYYVVNRVGYHPYDITIYINIIMADSPNGVQFKEAGSTILL